MPFDPAAVADLGPYATAVGINLAAIIGHHLDAAGVVQLPQRLADSLAVSRAVNDEYAALKPRWTNLELDAWSWSQFSPTPSITPSTIEEGWSRRECPWLEGIGFSVNIGPRVFDAIHKEKLAGFAHDLAGIQLPIRRLCRALATELGSDRAIYLPDSAYPISTVLDMVNAGHSIDDIIARLRDEFGAPATSLAAIYTAGERGHRVNGYFIDQFADL